MKFILSALIVLLVAASAQAADVGVSISVGQPGFYGRIDIGNAPRPELIYPQPIIIQPGPVRVVEEPLYLRVPPGHAKHWKKNCHKYKACGRPVYFVRDKWYQDVYVPHYREEHRDRGDRNRNDEGHHDHGNGHGHGHNRD
jgi:hypothetical protein